MHKKALSKFFTRTSASSVIFIVICPQEEANKQTQEHSEDLEH